MLGLLGTALGDAVRVAEADAPEQTAKPEIVRISPSRAEPGNLVAIEVAGFTDAAYKTGLVVSIGGRSAQILSQEPGELTVRVPNVFDLQGQSPQVIVASREYPELQAAANDRLSILAPPAESGSTDAVKQVADSDWPNWLLWAAPVAAAFVALVLGYAFGRTPRTKAVAPILEQVTVEMPATKVSVTETEPAVEIADSEYIDPNLRQLSLPRKLVEAMAQGEVVVHMGSGVGATSGLPTWPALMSELLSELEDRGQLDQSQTVSIQTVLKTGQNQYATEALNQAMRDRPQQISDALGSIIARYDAKPSDAHRLLAKLPFSAWLSGSFDMLFEQTVAEVSDKGGPGVFAPDQAERALDAVSREEPFVYKLYGSTTTQGPLTLGVQQYVDQVRSNAAYEELLDKLFLTRTLLFVGTSLQGIEDFMRGIEIRSKVGSPHYALSWLSGAHQRRDNVVHHLRVDVAAHRPFSRRPDAIQVWIRIGDCGGGVYIHDQAVAIPDQPGH